MKKCCTCKHIKPLGEFSKCQSRKDGLFDQCKLCKAKTQKKYRQTEKGRITHNKGNRIYGHTEMGKASARLRTKRWCSNPKGKKYRYDYNNSEKGRNAKRKYRLSKKGKINTHKHRKNNYAKYPDRNKARGAVKYAVKMGKLPNVKSLQCSYCSKQANIYHHYKGYDKIYHLVIEPVCYICHYKIHKSAASLF